MVACIFNVALCGGHPLVLRKLRLWRLELLDGQMEWIDALDAVGGIPSVFRSRNPHMFCATVEAGLLDGHMKWIDVLNTVGGVLSVF